MAHSFDLIVIGSGMGSLTASALLAKLGTKIAILEQNYLPGGCTSSYWRKGFTFESGATTLVGLDRQMPLEYVLAQTGIQLDVRKLPLPMQVHLKNGKIINRYQFLDQWIAEAERVFGKKGQAEFWRKCYSISQFVWDTSIKQRNFPPANFSDLMDAVKNATLSQVVNARYSLVRTSDFIKKHGLHENVDFMEFIDEQLLITAQNTQQEVNLLFGATALCYTNYNNYYVDGGLINLVTPFIDYIKKLDGELHLRTEVQQIEKTESGYLVKTNKGVFQSKMILSGIPINNLLKIYPPAISKYQSKIMDSPKLNSAFQMGIGFKSNKDFDSIHHQIHLRKPLAGVGAKSIFLSLSHPEDTTRSDVPGMKVASISTHVPNPQNNIIDTKIAENAVINILEDSGFLAKEDIVYQHSSSPKSWEKWTGRAFGFVGGYPQYFSIKPWQMIESRVDGQGMYQCGDTSYPGQGIPGTTLSGIIAVEKMMKDNRIMNNLK